LFELAKELIEEESVVFEQMMRSDYIGTIDQYNSLYGGVGLDLSYEDPLADLQEWFTNVADQNDQNANYARIRGYLKREFFDKGFVY